MSDEKYSIWLKDPYKDDDEFECLSMHQYLSLGELLEEIVKLTEGDWIVKVEKFDESGIKKVVAGYTTMPEGKWCSGAFVCKKEY